MKSYESRMTGMLRTVLPGRVGIRYREQGVWLVFINGDGWYEEATASASGDLRRRITGGMVVDLLIAARVTTGKGELRRLLRAAEDTALYLADAGWVEGREP